MCICETILLPPPTPTSLTFLFTFASSQIAVVQPHNDAASAILLTTAHANVRYIRIKKMPVYRLMFSDLCKLQQSQWSIHKKSCRNFFYKRESEEEWLNTIRAELS